MVRIIQFFVLILFSNIALSSSDFYVVLNPGLTEIQLSQADADDESNIRIDIDDVYNISIEEGLSNNSVNIKVTVKYSLAKMLGSYFESGGTNGVLVYKEEPYYLKIKPRRTRNTFTILEFPNKGLAIEIVNNYKSNKLFKKYPDTEKKDDDRGFLTGIGFLPRLSIHRGEAAMGIGSEYGVTITGLEMFEFGCSHGCGGGYGPTLRYGSSNGVQKIFLGASLFAGVGGIDVGPAYYVSENGGNKLGADITVRAVLLLLSYSWTKDDHKFNLGIGF